MSMQDPVSDMLTCVRNAQAIGINEVELPSSKMKLAILKVLQEEGYISDFQEFSAGDSERKYLKVTLKYHLGQPVIEKMRRVSTPGCRVYRPCDKLPLVRGGLGIAIISTSKGLMSDKQARTARLGGEVLCTVE
ncbi:MAG TPA: 30S ribosomal protein S8 [Gammaproteobacteria bacterium]|nr:30S ribosomal protein S8 [Gammaproteobacteria bacterium]